MCLGGGRRIEVVISASQSVSEKELLLARNKAEGRRATADPPPGRRFCSGSNEQDGCNDFAAINHAVHPPARQPRVGGGAATHLIRYNSGWW